MSKKNRKRPTEVDDKVVEQVTEVVVEPTSTDAAASTEEQPAKPTEPVVEVPAPVYGLIATPEELEKRPVRKGFEAALIAELANGPGTCQQLTNRLLASGEYARVAPKAAEHRPTKPTQYLLTMWVSSGRVAIASAEEAAAVRAAQNTAAIAASIEHAPEGEELPGEGSNAQTEATVGASV